MKLFSKKIGRTKIFGHISKKLIPYAGIKHRDKKENSKSFTISPIKKNLYTKDKIGNIILRTKTNLNSFIPKIKISGNKKHYIIIFIIILAFIIVLNLREMLDFCGNPFLDILCKK